MKHDWIANAFTDIDDAYINESHPAAVLAANGRLPREEGPVRRFLDSGWGAAILSTVAAVLVVVGVVFWGRLGARLPNPGGQNTETAEDDSPYRELLEELAIGVAFRYEVGKTHRIVYTDHLVTGVFYRDTDGERERLDITQPPLSEDGSLTARTEELRRDAPYVNGDVLFKTPEDTEITRITVYNEWWVPVKVTDLSSPDLCGFARIPEDGLYFAVVELTRRGGLHEPRPGMVFEVEEAVFEAVIGLRFDSSVLTAPTECPFTFDYALGGSATVKHGESVTVNYSMQCKFSGSYSCSASSVSYKKPLLHIYQTDGDGKTYTLLPPAEATDVSGILSWNAGELTSDSVTFTVPEDAPEGNYHIKVYFGGTPDWFMLFENALSVSEPAPSEFDRNCPFTFDYRIDAPHGVANGQTVTVDISMTQAWYESFSCNLTAPEHRKPLLAVYRTAPDGHVYTLVEDTARTDEPATFSMQGSETVRNTYTFRIPDDAPTGDYTVKVYFGEHPAWCMVAEKGLTVAAAPAVRHEPPGDSPFAFDYTIAAPDGFGICQRVTVDYGMVNRLAESYSREVTYGAAKNPMVAVYQVQPDGTRYTLSHVTTHFTGNRTLTWAPGERTEGSDTFLIPVTAPRGSYTVEVYFLENPDWCLRVENAFTVVDDPTLILPENGPFLFEYALNAPDGYMPQASFTVHTAMTNISEEEVYFYRRPLTDKYAQFRIYTVLADGSEYRLDKGVTPAHEQKNHVFLPGDTTSYQTTVTIPYDAPAGYYHLELYYADDPTYTITFENVFYLGGIDPNAPPDVTFRVTDESATRTLGSLSANLPAADFDPANPHAAIRMTDALRALAAAQWERPDGIFDTHSKLIDPSGTIVLRTTQRNRYAVVAVSLLDMDLGVIASLPGEELFFSNDLRGYPVAVGAEEGTPCFLVIRVAQLNEQGEYVAAYDFPAVYLRRDDACTRSPLTLTAGDQSLTLAEAYMGLTDEIADSAAGNYHASLPKSTLDALAERELPCVRPSELTDGKLTLSVAATEDDRLWLSNILIYNKETGEAVHSLCAFGESLDTARLTTSALGTLEPGTYYVTVRVTDRSLPVAEGNVALGLYLDYEYVFEVEID